MKQRPEGKTDIAALAAGIVAVSVSLFIAPGEFSVVNLIVSAALVALISGYVWSQPRTLPQSIAVAAALALSLVPTIGFLDEAFRSRDPLGYLLTTYEWDCNADPCASGEARSRVPSRDIAIGWIVCLIGTVTIDILRQRRSQSN